MKYLFMIFLLSGCSTKGFNRGELHSRLGQETVITDGDIAEALKSRPQLPNPFKIGVHFQQVEGNYWTTKNVRWTKEDKAKFLSLITEFKESLKVASVHEIVLEFGNQTSMKDLRMAGARQGVDAVLSVKSIAQREDSPNTWAWSYIAIVPMLFVPGTDHKGTFIAQAFLYDVKNGFTYFGAEGDSEVTLKKPPLSKYEELVVNEAKVKGIDQLLISMRNQLTSLAHQTK